MLRSRLAVLFAAVFVLAGTLAAQPDPSYDCRRRAAVLANTPFKNMTAKRRGGLANGNVMVWWNAKLANGKSITGFCEADPQTGRTVRMGIDQSDWGSVNRKFRITPEDAERVCRIEARARFSPGNGELSAFFLPNTSTKHTYRVEWRYSSITRTIREGRCEVDSDTGLLRSFDANNGW
jgi:hypothetical protein